MDYSNQLCLWYSRGIISLAQKELTLTITNCLRERGIDYSLEGPCCEEGEKTILLILRKSHLLLEIDEKDVSVLEIIQPNVLVEKYIFHGFDLHSIISHLESKLPKNG